MGMTDEEAQLHDTLSELKTHLRSNDSSKIILIGDVMMDCYIHGYANNLNSRAPVPVLRETSREEDVGAAAHVARGLRAMGMESHLFGVVGDDAAGLSIIESLESEGVTTHGIAIIEDRTTTVKTRMLASRESLIREEQLLLRWDIEDDTPVPEDASEALYEQAEMTTTTDLEQSNRVAGLVGLAVASRAWERAQAQIRRLRRMKIDHRVHDANVRRREADLALRSGDWLSAARLGQEAAGIYEHAGEPSAAARALRLSGDAEALQGQVHAAMALFRRAAEEQFRLGDWSSLRVTLRHASALCSEDARQKLGKLSTELTLLGGAL